MKTSYTYFRKNDGLICTMAVFELSDSEFAIELEYSDGSSEMVQSGEADVFATWPTQEEAARYCEKMVSALLEADAITFEIPLYTVEEVQEAQNVLETVANLVGGNEILLGAIGANAFRCNLSRVSEYLSTIKSQCPRSKAVLRGEKNV